MNTITMSGYGIIIDREDSYKQAEMFYGYAKIRGGRTA